MSGLEILALSGPASVQDRGRPGWQRWGVPEGGALDPFALAEGQALMGSGPDAAALEMPGAGGRFRARAAMAVATSGAAMPVAVNGVARGWRSVLALGPGEVLEIGAARDGAVGYLHLSGGIDAPVVLGARSAHRRAGLGLVPRPGEVLRPLGQGGVAGRSLPRPDYFDRRTIRAMWGPQSGLFDASARARFAGETFAATARRDRQGMRIAAEGGPFDAAAGLRVLSEAVVPGDVQLPGDGVPAVLLAERQPTGGYPRIATVIAADLPALVQMPPGTRYRFCMVDRATALAARAAFMADVAALPGRVAESGAALLHAANLIGGVVRGDEGEDHADRP
jgi:5-oxoprolinase (ATP-hydrolysing) subunit C